jgi:signal transduction histidine kinase
MAEAEVPPGQDRLEFQFTVLSFVAPEHVRRRHRLVGYDRGWIEGAAGRAAYYTRVPPGRYRFEVEAANEDGAEGRAVLAVVVWPAWHERPLLRALGFLLATAAVAALYLRRVRALQRARAESAEFSRRLIRSQDDERARLAGELHDGLGQELQLIRNRAELALRRHDPAPPLASELREISGTAARAIQGVRALARGLRPPELDQLGLTEALRWLARELAAVFAGRLESRVDDVGGLLPRAAEVDFYRIAQEALNNAVKHAVATEITLEVLRGPGVVQLAVFDNGRGLPAPALGAAEPAAGSGLRIMRERAALLGGELAFATSPGVGTRLTLTVPAPNITVAPP